MERKTQTLIYPFVYMYIQTNDCIYLCKCNIDLYLGKIHGKFIILVREIVKSCQCRDCGFRLARLQLLWCRVLGFQSVVGVVVQSSRGGGGGDGCYSAVSEGL